MEMYRAEVCIGGLLTNTVVKEPVTAAEIVILRRVHGDDAVRGIKLLGSKNREYQKEYDRLVKTYGRHKVEAAFPGARPILPQNLKDIGIIVQKDGFINQEVVAKGPNNKNVKTKREKELDALGINDDDEGDDNDDAGDDSGEDDQE